MIRSRLSKPLALMALMLTAATMPALAAPPSPEAVTARIESLQGDAAGFANAFDRLTEAMREDDASGVADLAEYPLTVQANGETYDVLEPRDLVDNFDRLVAPQTRNAIADQDYSALFVNSDGVSFANDALWMALICDDDACSTSHWGIVAINN